MYYPPKMTFRGQYDVEAQQEVALATRFDFSEPVVVRAEFGPDSEVKNIIRKYGGPLQQLSSAAGSHHATFAATGRMPLFTDTDYDIDLQQAVTKIRAAEEAFDRLPRKTRERYGSPAGLHDADRRGYIPDEAPTTLNPDSTLANQRNKRLDLEEPSTGEPRERTRKRSQARETTRPESRTPGEDAGTEQR